MASQWANDADWADLQNDIARDDSPDGSMAYRPAFYDDEDDDYGY